MPVNNGDPSDQERSRKDQDQDSLDNADPVDARPTVDVRQELARQQRMAQSLRRIHRSRSRLMVCFYTLPLYVMALIMLLNEGRGVTLLMFVYMGVYAVFAVDMVLRECPRCGKQFFVNVLFLNFFARRCVHCGLSCRPLKDSDGHPHGRKF